MDLCTTCGESRRGGRHCSSSFHRGNTHGIAGQRDMSGAIRKLVGEMRKSEQRTAEKLGPFTRSVEPFDFGEDGKPDIGTIGIIRDRNGAVFGYCHPDQIETVDVSPYAFLTWDPNDPAWGDSVHSALTTVRQERGLTRNGRMRSVLRDVQLWRLLTACVVAGREVEVRT